MLAYLVAEPLVAPMHRDLLAFVRRHMLRVGLLLHRLGSMARVVVVQVMVRGMVRVMVRMMIRVIRFVARICREM